ncbi:MAG TPA: helix-turn-helix transcriptional regulator [Blastocatellia bacterium]|nr:helix-turn-helix transcriptional regulator [Blastocatellia bacterium]
MALKLRVEDVARKLGIENAAQLASLTGLGLTSCYQLWQGTAQMISLKTLNTLCNKLKAHPALLFDYMPDTEERAMTIRKHQHKRGQLSAKGRRKA